ncbi:MAG: NUDIX hydrolase [Acidimicrobiales bacterium]
MVARFRKTGEQEVFAGAVISVGTATFEGPAGEVFDRDIVHHPGAVSVVPVIEDGTAVLLVRQFRAAINDSLLEIPAGKRDVPGEAPDVTARRELVEEIGMRAGRMELLARFYNSPGFCDELSYTYLGLDLEPTERDLQGPEEAAMTIERVLLDDVPGMIADGRLIDAKTIIGLSLARSVLG